MSHPLGVDGLVELAVVERSGLIESRHLGAAIVLSPDGSERALGDAEGLIYPRSTLKLMQAVAVQRLGARLDGAELVLSAASHVGTPAHVDAVHAILARAGLDDDALACPVSWPADAASRRAASGPERVTMGCSGKHAAFVLACVRQGWPTEGYLHPEHPLQRAILEVVEELSGERVEHAGVDGCGAPVFALTLRGLARGVRSAVADPDGARLADAIRTHPWALDNPSVTAVIRETGLVAKSGAEGVFVAVAADGTTVALKVIDGSQRALVPVGLALLEQSDAVDAVAAARVVSETTERVLGGGEDVGVLRATV